MSESLQKLIEAVLQSPKYRDIEPSVVARIGAEELERNRSLKEAIKAAKNRLHQSTGAYLTRSMEYRRWLGDLADANNRGFDEWKQVLAVILGYHLSTQERLSSMETLYDWVGVEVGGVESVLDIGCGFNPLALPWMGFASTTRYHAMDVPQDLMQFLQVALEPNYPNFRATACDAVTTLPTEAVDIALILKFLPVLEQNLRGNTADWLARIPAKHLLVTFPSRTIGGRNIGMATQYEARFHQTLDTLQWKAKRLMTANELAFLVTH